MHKAFFGDRERDFLLTPPMIRELQSVTGKPLGHFTSHMRALAYEDITETIRLAMIGGGTSPEIAASLVATYIPVRPFAEAQVLATDIITVLWLGPDAVEKREVVTDDF